MKVLILHYADGGTSYFGPFPGRSVADRYARKAQEAMHGIVRWHVVDMIRPSDVVQSILYIEDEEAYRAKINPPHSTR